MNKLLCTIKKSSNVLTNCNTVYELDARRNDHFQRNILFSIMTSLDFQLLTNVTSSHQVCSRGLSKKIDAF